MVTKWGKGLSEIGGVKYGWAGECFKPDESSRLLMDSLVVREGDRLLDMGCGTGVVGISAAMKGAKVWCVDVSPEAVDEARLNCERNGVEVDAVESDLFAEVPGVFDVVAFNPPYSRERRDAGEDLRTLGKNKVSRIDVVRRFIEGLPGKLARGGTGYVVLSTRSPVATFRAAAETAGLTWSVCRTCQVGEEQVLVVEMRKRKVSAGAARRTPAWT